MVYRLLADIVLIIHIAFVLYALLGAFLVLKWRWTVWVHLPAAFWAAFIEFTGWICPLTPLENMLRHQARDSVYHTGFIEHYILPVLYPAALNENTQFILGIIVLLVNLSIYGWIFKRAPFRQRLK
jgi:hypothetical protein